MAHHDQIRFFEIARAHFPEFFDGCDVLEVGSLDINGSVRGLFSGGRYVGLDVGPGPGVDVVCPGEEFDGPADSFDVVLSAECLEHNPNWRRTVENMLRLLRPGGLFLLTCAAPGRPEHGTRRTTPADSPLTVEAGSDYYRNLGARDLRSVRALRRHLPAAQYWMNWSVRDTYVAGVKSGAPDARWANFTQEVSAWLHASNPMYARRRVEVFVLGAFGSRAYEFSIPAIDGLSRLRRRRDG